MSYARESNELDAAILEAIGAWHRHGRALSDEAFNELALRLFAYQLKYNQPYARYCASRGVDAAHLPASWEAIPAVPSAAFKEAVLATFDPAQAALVFQTSGTTAGIGGMHYMQTRALYDAALLAGFDRFMLPDAARLRYLNLVPNPAWNPRSSLGYMMNHVARHRGDDRTGWYVTENDVLADAFAADIQEAVETQTPVCIATTAFALLAAVESLDRRNLRFALPAGSRVMETGGFKGRTRVVERDELYARACECFGLPDDAIVAEYGMTELTSQYYDGRCVFDLRAPRGTRRKLSPPWLRARVTGAGGETLPDGTVGALVHVDLANRSSCVAIATEDLGARFDDGLVLFGREAGAALRGCSLDAETLAAR